MYTGKRKAARTHGHEYMTRLVYPNKSIPRQDHVYHVYESKNLSEPWKDESIVKFPTRRQCKTFIDNDESLYCLRDEIWAVFKNGYEIKRFARRDQAQAFVEDMIRNEKPILNFADNLKRLKRELETNPDFYKEPVVVLGFEFKNIEHVAEAYECEEESVAFVLVDRYIPEVCFKRELTEEDKVRKYKHIKDLPENRWF